jgi:hypothetical protein
MSEAARYRWICVAAGLVAAWLPYLLHGPVPEKLDRVRLNGAIAVWGWYTARMLIGLVVAATAWPRPFWLRGVLFGALVMLPCGIVSLGTPGCGPDCMAANLSTGALVGVLAGGTAWWVTGKDHA